MIETAKPHPLEEEAARQKSIDMSIGRSRRTTRKMDKTVKRMEGKLSLEQKMKQAGVQSGKKTKKTGKGRKSGR